MDIILLTWALAAVSFYVSQKYNRHSYEVFFAGLSLLLHGGLTALLIRASMMYILAGFTVVFMGVIVASAISGNQATRRQNRMKEWLELQGIFVIFMGLGFILHNISVPIAVSVVALSLFLVSCVHLLLTRHLGRYKTSKPQNKHDADHLPSVSLLIPARNEDHALKSSLERAIKSSYKKLEILVLDDCSHDKTPEIIRGFAHDGVRFVQGKPLTEPWLGKNHAAEQLREAANGEILLFCDVDVAMGKNAITDIVNIMLERELEMLTVLPQRRVYDKLATIFRPLTDFLLCVLPFKLLDTRAALGECYAIRAQSLRKLNGFQGIKNEVFPEFTIAKRLINANSYAFLLSRNVMDITIRKKFSSQEESLIRTLFPALDNNVPLVLTSLILGGIVLTPYALLLTPYYLLGAITSTLWSFAYARAVLATHGSRTAPLAFIQFPVLVMHECVLVIVSMHKYLFSEVVWKERNICLPVLETEPKLPVID